MDIEGKKWVGVIDRFALVVTKESIKSLSGPIGEADSERIMNYFSSTSDLQSIQSTFPKDDFLEKAIREFAGLRLLTQDPWECLISFVCSINKNIPAIRLAIENLCQKFGTPIHSDQGTFYSFPRAEALAAASKRELIECKVGFRWKYIKFIARKVASSELDLENLKSLDYQDAKSELISELSRRTFGVGPKVADCVLLFSLGKTEAFPIDVWMLRCIRKNYSKILPATLNPLITKSNSLGPKTYSLLSEAMRGHFGKYAGYAQQYLYMETRTDSRKGGPGSYA